MKFFFFVFLLFLLGETKSSFSSSREYAYLKKKLITLTEEERSSVVLFEPFSLGDSKPDWKRHWNTTGDVPRIKRIGRDDMLCISSNDKTEIKISIKADYPKSPLTVNFEMYVPSIPREGKLTMKLTSANNNKRSVDVMFNCSRHFVVVSVNKEMALFSEFEKTIETVTVLLKPSGQISISNSQRTILKTDLPPTVLPHNGNLVLSFSADPVGHPLYIDNVVVVNDPSAIEPFDELTAKRKRYVYGNKLISSSSSFLGYYINKMKSMWELFTAKMENDLLFKMAMWERKTGTDFSQITITAISILVSLIVLLFIWFAITEPIVSKKKTD